MGDFHNVPRQAFDLGEGARMVMHPLTLLLVSLGLAALPFLYQMLPTDSSTMQQSEVAEALRTGGDLSEYLGATAAGVGVTMSPAAQEEEVAAYLDRSQDPAHDPVLTVGLRGTLGDVAGDYPEYPVATAVGLRDTLGDVAGDYPQYPSAAVLAAQALARGGDLSRQMAPTAAGERAK